MTLLKKTIPNPWRKNLPSAAALELAAGNNLTYSTRTLRVSRLSVPEQCAAAAHTLGYPVPCPGLLPRGVHAMVFPAGTPCGGRVDLIGPGCDGASRNLFASLEWPATRRVGHFVLVGLPNRGSARDVIFSPLRAGTPEPRRCGCCRNSALPALRASIRTNCPAACASAWR